MLTQIIRTAVRHPGLLFRWALVTLAVRALASGAFTAPTAWTSLASLTKARLDEQVYANILFLSTHAHSGAAGDGSATLSASAVVSPWAAWTPSWTGLVIGNAVVTCRWTQVGKIVHAKMRIVFGNSSSFSGTFTATLPATSALAIGTILGNGFGFDSNLGLINVGLQVNQATTTTMSWYVTAASNFNVNNTVPWTWATSDTLNADIVFEVA